MASKADIHLVLLWEDELRIAAKALKAAHEASNEDFARLGTIALQACMAALWGVTDDCALAMLASSEIRTRVEPAAPDSARGEQP